MAFAVTLTLDAASAEERGAAGGLSAFMATYLCPVYEILQRIHAQDMKLNDRYLILSTDGAQRYVQCIFHDGDTQIYCEASSGFYGPPRLRFSRAKVGALNALGFSTDASHGNFRLDRPVNHDSDLWDVARLMLEALYRAYGAGLKRRILMDAPYAPGRFLPRAEESCAAIS